MSSATAWNWLESAIVIFANESKSFSLIALIIASILCGTTCLIRCWSKAEVSTVRCIPVVEDVPFLASLTTQMSACMVGQWDWGATSTARESVPEGREPASQATKPPKRERQAEPEPRRATRESSDGEAIEGLAEEEEGKVLRPYNAAMDEVRAANPEAEEARPAAVGKLLYEAT